MEVEPIPTYLPLISKNVARKSEAIQKDTNFLDDKDINVSCVSEKKLERYKQDHLYILMETLLTVDDLSLASDKIKSDQFQIIALKALLFVLTRKSVRTQRFNSKLQEKITTLGIKLPKKLQNIQLCVRDQKIWKSSIISAFALVRLGRN